MLKDELEAIIASDNAWSGRATLLLAIGILGEYVAAPFFEHANIGLMMAVFRSRRATALRNAIKRCGAVLKTLFAAMVLAGVVGEYGFSSRIAINANRLQRIADQELADATDRATQAIELGGVIGDRADRLARLLKTEQETTARFQKQAKLSQDALTNKLSEVDVAVKRRTPREVLLTNARIGNDPRLTQFSGQVAVYVFDCEGEALKQGSSKSPDPEVAMTSYRLALELITAGWRAVLDNRDCGGGTERTGITLAINPDVTELTHKAAQALVSVLRDTLLLPDGDIGASVEEIKIGVLVPQIDPTGTRTIGVKVNPPVPR